MKTNGCGMLYLHRLIWLQGNIELESLRGHMLKDGKLAQRMIKYLEYIISKVIKPDMAAGEGTTLPIEVPWLKDFQDLKDYQIAIMQDALAITATKQIHSPQHTATCFKYNCHIRTQRYRF